MKTARETRSTTRRAQSPAPRTIQGDIQQYFVPSLQVSPDVTVATLHSSSQAVSTKPSRSALPHMPDSKLEATVYSQPAQAEAGDPLQAEDTGNMEGDIRALLRELPTRRDIEDLIRRVEESHHRDIQAVRADFETLVERVNIGEGNVSSLEQRVKAIEKTQTFQADTAVELQLHMEVLEDRSRHNNLRFRGIPEVMEVEDLQKIVNTICQTALESPQLEVELDRVHRAPGPKPRDPERPRDVICRLYKYSQKEQILRAAWEVGNIDFEGNPVKILADLSRATLQRRACLRPILELAKKQGYTYRWGYPLTVTFRKASSSYILRTPTDLPGLFAFMDVPPIQTPNWLFYIPHMGGRSSPQSKQGRGNNS